MKKKEVGSNSAEDHAENGQENDSQTSMDKLAALTRRVLAAGRIQNQKKTRQRRDAPP